MSIFYSFGDHSETLFRRNPTMQLSNKGAQVMPNNGTGDVCARVGLYCLDSGRSEDTDAPVGTLMVGGSALRIDQPEGLGRQRVDAICKKLIEFRKKTDPVERMELFATCGLFGSIRHWYLDMQRGGAVVDALDKLAPVSSHMDAAAWFSVFVLVKPMSKRRYGSTLQTSIEHARELGTPWMLKVLGHWLYTSSGTLPLAPLRRKIVETLVPLWQHVGLRDEIAPILGAVSWLPGYDRHCPARSTDWEAVFALLPNGATDQNPLSEAESILAAGLMSGAELLDAASEPRRRVYVGRLRANLGSQAEKIKNGEERLMEWSHKVGVSSAESKAYSALKWALSRAEGDYFLYRQRPSDFDHTH